MIDQRARVAALACGLAAALLADISPAAAAQPSRRVPPPCPDGAAPVLVESTLARRAGLAPGDRVRLAREADSAGCPAVVAGVYEPRADPSRLTLQRPRILLHLPDLATLLGRPDEVDRFSIRLRAGVRPEAVLPDLRSLLPGTRVIPTAEVARRSSTTFEVIRRFHRAIGMITIAAGGIFLACIMTLKIRERRVPVAALRLVGISRRTLLGWLIAEAAAVAVLGGILGIGLGRLAADVINRYYRAEYDTTLAFAVVTPATVWTAIALAVLLGLGAGLVAAVPLLSRDALDEVR